MSVYLVILIAWKVASPVTGFCQLGDCSISDESECSWGDLVKEGFYAPVEQNMPQVTDVDHLFNFLNNPFEKNCVQISFTTFYSKDDGYTILLHVQRASEMYGGIRIVFLIQFHQSSNSSISCFQRDALREYQRKKCAFFVHEQLRLTFFENNEFLLIEDLSSRVPKGTRLILRKIGYQVDMKCLCDDLESYGYDTIQCLLDAEQELENSKYKQKKATGNNTKKITGSVVGLLFLLALLFTCNMCFKLKFCYGS